MRTPRGWRTVAFLLLTTGWFPWLFRPPPHPRKPQPSRPTSHRRDGMRPAGFPPLSSCTSQSVNFNSLLLPFLLENKKSPLRQRPVFLFGSLTPPCPAFPLFCFIYALFLQRTGSLPRVSALFLLPTFSGAHMFLIPTSAVSSEDHEQHLHLQVWEGGGFLGVSFHDPHPQGLPQRLSLQPSTGGAFLLSILLHSVSFPPFSYHNVHTLCVFLGLIPRAPNLLRN